MKPKLPPLSPDPHQVTEDLIRRYQGDGIFQHQPPQPPFGPEGPEGESPTTGPDLPFPLEP